MDFRICSRLSIWTTQIGQPLHRVHMDRKTWCNFKISYVYKLPKTFYFRHHMNQYYGQYDINNILISNNVS